MVEGITSHLFCVRVSLSSDKNTGQIVLSVHATPG